MNELITALDKNDMPALQALLEHKIDPNVKDQQGRTVLMYAALNGKEEALLLLLRHGANINAKDKAGLSALHFAAQDYRPGAVALLCQAGAEIDAVDKFGNTPLGKAVFSSRGRGEVIKVLLIHGADKNKKNNHNSSPLNLANLIANYDVKQFLSGK